MFQSYNAAFRQHATKAFMKERNLTWFQARLAVSKCENASPAVVKQAIGSDDLGNGVLVAVSVPAGIPVKQFGDGSIIANIGKMFNNAISWISDPANAAKIQAAIANLMKIAAIIMPLFGLAKGMPTTMSVAIGLSINIDQIKSELEDLKTVQQAALDAQIVLSGAEATLADTIATQAAFVSNATAIRDSAQVALTDAQKLDGAEVDYLIKLLNNDPSATDPTPVPVPDPIPAPVPVPDPAPVPTPVPTPVPVPPVPDGGSANSPIG